MRSSAPAAVMSRMLSGPLALLGTGLLALVSAGCENLAIGRSCDTLVPETSVSSGAFNDQALECPSRICIKPPRATGVGIDTQTAAFCTAECSGNDDCAESEKRDSKNAMDKRCSTGFTCGVAFAVGPLACKKLCICKDFTPAAGLKEPVSCMNAAKS
ncbi:MAG: hypothetical protein SGI86_01505 [Deltaproteobacteria bacterium]|nr:hypothetical protein [Deltaproteobacteria bacterium]